MPFDDKYMPHLKLWPGDMCGGGAGTGQSAGFVGDGEGVVR
jgi:hypothetical protein